MNLRRVTQQDLPSSRRYGMKALFQPRRLFVLALVLTPAVEAVTQEPVVEDTVFAGRPALVARPEGEGSWPALLFVNGTIREGRNYPPVQNLARGLARAGYLVVVPDLPGLTNDEITPQTVSSTVEVAQAVAVDRPDA